MNILIASIFSYNSYSRGIMPDVLQSVIDTHPEANIYYLTNSGSFNVCYFNINKRPEICYRCKIGVKSALKLIHGKFHHIKISDVVSREEQIIAEAFYKNEEKVTFQQKFENFEVGESTLSTYISHTRDRELIYVKKDFVKELGKNAISLYLGLKRFLKEKEIDVVYNFNGRQEYVRAVMRATLASSLHCYNIEQARTGGFVESFKDVLSHNIKAKKDHVENIWVNSKEAEEDKIRIGRSFFEKQRSGGSIIFPSHLKGQERHLLPKEIYESEGNIILFTSSDDEFAALGKDFKNPLFIDQNEGIEYLVNTIGELFSEKNLFIRMHPNLKNVNFDYVKKIRALHKKYSNIFVIFPESKVDSYALLEKAEKVFSFGSTLGMEATYYGKPSVLLGKCYFYYSNVAYTPLEKQEIQEIIGKPLLPKPQLNAIKFGYYYLKGGLKTEYYSQTEVLGKVTFKGLEIPQYSVKHRLIARVIKMVYDLTGVRLKLN